MLDSVSESFAGIMKRVIFKHSECGHAILEVSFLLPQVTIIQFSGLHGDGWAKEKLCI